MGNWNLGSVQVEVSKLIPDIPTALSGTEMYPLIDRKRQRVEDYVGQDIGSNSIDIKYQEAIVNLSASAVCESMMLTGADVKSIKLGDFSETKGEGGNLNIASKSFEAKGEKALKNLGRSVSYYKVY